MADRFSPEGVRIAIVGATGLLGEALLEQLASSGFPVASIAALASTESKGETVLFAGKAIAVQVVDGFDFSQCQLAFFVATPTVSEQHARRAAEQGCYVVDATGYFSADADVPLIMPGIGIVAGDTASRIFASPGSVAAIAARLLYPLMATTELESVQINGILSVADAGRKAVSELAGQTARLLNGQPADASVFEQQIAFNIVPQPEATGGSGFSRQELQLMVELPRLLGVDNLLVQSKLLWASVFYGHRVDIDVQMVQPIEASAVSAAIASVPGNAFNATSSLTPMVQHDADAVLSFGSPRLHPRSPRWLHLCAVSDSLRGSGSQNLVHIAEFLLKSYF